ncbi:hypothetical protein [Mumia sp. ZJ1417]|uniref:hypothetical protein n=1 Tax=Mumia sp. ZJ1417 TaxID=2708082 RepID=UPI001FB8ACEC|nr:hypothetical protein [Mumia sp. ZJ1417]
MSRPALRTTLAEIGIVCGTLPWVWLTLRPAGGAAHGTVSLVPLRDLSSMPPYQVVGNLLVFAALGFFAPYGSARSRPSPVPSPSRQSARS